MIALGWMTVFGLPLTVVFAAIFWPERIPKDQTVEAIRRQVESEESDCPEDNF
ncbi:hypothetical protein ACWEO2_19815 [Nocardia sp. NPDC004278]